MVRKFILHKYRNDLSSMSSMVSVVSELVTMVTAIPTSSMGETGQQLGEQDTSPITTTLPPTTTQPEDELAIYDSGAIDHNSVPDAGEHTKEEYEDEYEEYYREFHDRGELMSDTE